MEKLLFCESGSCVDVSKAKCSEKFDDMGDIIACEQLQEMKYGQTN